MKNLFGRAGFFMRYYLLEKIQNIDINSMGPEKYFRLNSPLTATSYLTKSDINKFIDLVYKIELSKKIYFFTVISFAFAVLMINTMNVTVFFKNMVLVAMFFLAVHLIIPYLYVKLRVALRDKFIDYPKYFCFDARGIEVKSPLSKVLFDWDMIQHIQIFKKYVYFIGPNYMEVYLIPLKSFQSDEERKSLEVLISEITGIRQYFNRKKVRNLYYLGIFGLIPVFGFIAGLIIFKKNFYINNKWLKIIATIDILISVLVFFLNNDIAMEWIKG